MPDKNYYSKLLQFHRELLKIETITTPNQTYIEKLLDVLDKTLGYTNTMMASLSNTGVKQLTPNLVTHKVDFTFAQKLLVAYWSDNSLLDLSSDLFILSKSTDYKNSALYTTLLRPSGYKDLMLQFVKDSASGKYLSYIIYLNTRGEFTSADVEIAAAISESVAQGHLNSILVWDLHDRINLLVDCMNYYPLGLMLVGKANKIVYINDLAAEYLGDLGVTDSRLYSTFYTNNIHPYFLHSGMHSKSQPVRIGSYLINVSPTSGTERCPAVKLFGRQAGVDNDSFLNITSDVISCVYIIKDSGTSARLDSSAMASLGLTRRQQDIAEAVAQGLNNKELADRMGITENTVKTHLANIYKKLGINYRTELVDMLYKAQGK